jgi:hypothetical protein
VKRNIFKSSTESRNSEKLVLAHKSLIKILNDRGPKVEPCGTPDSVRKGEKKLLKVRTTENLDDKSLWIQLI